MLFAVLASSASAFAYKAPVAYGPEAIMQEPGGAPADGADAKKGEKKKGKKGDKKKDEGKEEKSDK
jgi:hypothetical protein